MDVAALASSVFFTMVRSETWASYQGWPIWHPFHAVGHPYPRSSRRQGPQTSAQTGTSVDWNTGALTSPRLAEGSSASATPSPAIAAVLATGTIAAGAGRFVAVNALVFCTLMVCMATGSGTQDVTVRVPLLRLGLLCHPIGETCTTWPNPHSAAGCWCTPSCSVLLWLGWHMQCLLLLLRRGQHAPWPSRVLSTGCMS